ncbi:unnamed protein product [Parnassius apollo]|uniref:(apollo) hypothetical protein n=1 Tax=Parnassius apollo TaxID=110799 RepID=A0A8S3WS28_PARAO|nr:unnamed protein product [Parnassius apollo]
MEKKIVRKGPLPGGRQGASGAGAGRDSMRAASRARGVARPPSSPPHPSSPPEGLVSAGSSRTQQAALAAGGARRMSWSKLMNANALWSYFRAKEEETGCLAYRARMHRFFAEMELERLRREAIPSSNGNATAGNAAPLDAQQTAYVDAAVNIPFVANSDDQKSGITDNEEPDTESLDLNTENHTTNENENLHREKIIAIDEMFTKALEYCANTNPTERQFIPKQRSSKKFSKLVAYVNNILLPQYINSEIEFKTFQNLVYCAAWTSAKLNGAKIEIAIQVDNPLGPEKQKKYNKPKWEQRLENKFELKLFLRKRERHELLLQKSRTLFSNLLKEAPPLYVRYTPEGVPSSTDRMPIQLSSSKDSCCRWTTMPLLTRDRLEGLGSPVKECGVTCKDYLDIHKRCTAENIFSLVSDVQTKTKG